MLGLAIHTCGPALGLALSNFDGDARHQTWPLGRDLSLHLHNRLIEFLAPYSWQELSFLAVAQGPGGFTGTRIGVVTARTLAQQLEIPLFGVSSLAAVAQGAAQDKAQEAAQDKAQAEAVAVEMPAQRGQLFTAIYQPTAAGLTAACPDQVMAAAAWRAVVANYPQALRRVVAGGDLAATVVQVLELAHQGWQRGERPAWAAVLPYYGQHPVDR
ncbi:MAG TPA: tRNA (adenosine(37)-N6)-threonylcarbamoyltransferase complex dimerization subunit type 1 TsaB [Nodosilinea sp.]|nr:tRNA (adenosine(37)-N6)-threonylcarbamoyltransferase complex dimerization subunit type 1 TsaB [Nodosilinea sp.]